MRAYFEELVAVYEGHKQGNGNAWVSTGATSGSQIAFVNNSNTLGVTGNGYTAGWFLKWYDKSSNPNYYTYHRQAFFNGTYGRSATAEVFGGRETSTTLTPSTDVFVYGNKTQLATLEGWYSYCQEALTAATGNTTYENRIKIEMIFPEYAYLVYHSTYSGGYTEKDPSVTSTFPKGDNKSSVIPSTSYQEFYNRVKALGFEKPSEFYSFDSTDAPDTDCVFGTASYTYRYIYESFWKNWGITA